jgi:transcriptional regulator with XRE-family HTH domain
MSLRRILADNIVKLRKERGLSQEALCHETKISRRYMSKAENGEAAVSVDVIERIADVLEVEAADLLKAPRAKAQK